MSAVLVAGVVAGAGRALAQEAPATSPLAQMAQAGRTISFDIPAQSLAAALTAFGQQSGVQIVVDPASAAGKSSRAVSGTMIAEQALQRLLAGSGLSYRFTSANTVAVSASIGSGTFQLDPVQVQGVHAPAQAMIGNLPPPYAGGQVATGGQVGFLGNRDVMDTPFNVTSFTAKKAQDQQAKTVRDVFIDDPSVRVTYPDAAAADDTIWVRGFQVFADNYAYSGLYGVLPTFSVMAELAERIEILKGPSAMVNGMAPSGAIGGTINVVPKRAGNEPLTQLTAGYTSNAQFGAHADVARRFGTDKQFGVRFNGVYKGGQAPVEWVTDTRGLASLGLDFRGDRVRLAADLGYQYQYIGGALGHLGVGVGVPLPWAPGNSHNPGQPWNYSERKDLFGVVRGEFDITDRVTAYAAVGMHDYRRSGFAGSSRLTITNLAGNAVSSPYLQSVYSSYLTAETGVRALVDTGPIGHEFALSATYYKRTDGNGVTNGTPFATNIYNPTVVARPSLAQPAANKVSSSDLTSYAIADTLSAADKRIQLTVGARLQRVQSANFAQLTGMQMTSYDQSKITPAVALVVKPWKNVSLYGNYIQALQQGAVVGSTFTNAGEVFPPYVSTQYEVGVKIDWGKVTTTASLFSISQPSVITDVATNTQMLAGQQRNEGLELNLFGEVTEGFRVLGGATFLNPVLAQTQGGLTNGWIAPMTPQTLVNLGAEVDLGFAPGLTLTGRTIYTGSQYLDTTWPRRSLPEWVRFDLGARYTLDDVRSPTAKPIVLRFNVENVLDTTYWAGGSGATSLYLGAPRTFRLSLTTDF